MKIVPKFQKGGYTSYFTMYQPVKVPELETKTTSSESTTTTKKKSSKSDDDEDDTKGKLTEKDFFNMIKDINGLPNEMTEIVQNLTRTFQLQNLTGLNTQDLATTYLKNLLQIKIAAQNKTKYDKAWENAAANGSMAEPAIALNGDIMVQTKDGKLTNVNLATYYANKDQFTPLSVSQLLNLRAHSKSANWDQKIFNIVNNSMGFESFSALLEKAKTTLGSNSYSETGIRGKDALLGLQVINSLPQKEKEKYIQWAVDGVYNYDSANTSNVEQINALLNYMVTTLPQRAKTWAAIKTGITDENTAAKVLIGEYLKSGVINNSSYKVTYAGTQEDLMGTDKSSKNGSAANSADKTDAGFWTQLQAGQGGDDMPYTLINGKGVQTIDGKYYGTTPGLEGDMSLGSYISKSKLGYLIKDTHDITFGDIPISTDSFRDVMINAASGVMAVTLPKKLDGTVDLSIASKYTAIVDQLKREKIDPGTDHYNKRMAQLLKANELDTLLTSDGMPNPNRFGFFLVLTGLTSKKAKGVTNTSNNETKSFEDINSDWIVNAGDENSLYETLKAGLTEGKTKYDADAAGYGTFYNDDLYKGNIYIPLNINPINAKNADNSTISDAESRLYEKLTQQKSSESTQL